MGEINCDKAEFLIIEADGLWRIMVKCYYDSLNLFYASFELSERGKSKGVEFLKFLFVFRLK